jgi:hypothetical protein
MVKIRKNCLGAIQGIDERRGGKTTPAPAGGFDISYKCTILRRYGDDLVFSPLNGCRIAFADQPYLGQDLACISMIKVGYT